MNRKSTVLIAALVNSAFLVALFSTAVRTTDKQEQMASPQLTAEVAPPPILSTDGAGHKELHTSPPAVELPETLLHDIPQMKSKEPLATAPAPLQAPEAKEGDFVEIEVKKGDVLERIAKANGTTVARLMEINSLKGPWLKIGQKLKVPRREKQPSRIDSSPEFYTVKKGDNLWIIASKFKVSISDLKRLNHLDDESAKRLKVNDQLRIR